LKHTIGYSFIVISFSSFLFCLFLIQSSAELQFTVMSTAN